MSLGSLCISVSLGLVVLFALSVGIALRRERPSKEDLKSAVLIHLQFTAEQWHVWGKSEWALAEESSTRHHLKMLPPFSINKETVELFAGRVAR